MASINHLEMCDQLKALPEIEIKKTCFGLFTQAVYKPSQSVIKVNQNEYSVEVGGQLEKLLNGGNNTIMEQRNKGKKYSKSDMGNMRLDTCISKDRQFVGRLQLQTCYRHGGLRRKDGRSLCRTFRLSLSKEQRPHNGIAAKAPKVQQ